MDFPLLRGSVPLTPGVVPGAPAPPPAPQWAPCPSPDPQERPSAKCPAALPRPPAAHTSRPALYHDPSRRAALDAGGPAASANAGPFPPLGFWPRTRPRRPEVGTRPLTSRNGDTPPDAPRLRARGLVPSCERRPCQPVSSRPTRGVGLEPGLRRSPCPRTRLERTGRAGGDGRASTGLCKARRGRRPSSGQAVISKELGAIVPSGRGPPRHGTCAPAALRSLPRGLLGGSLWLALVAPQHCERLRAPGLGPSVE